MTNRTNMLHHPVFKALSVAFIIVGLYVLSAECAHAGIFDAVKAPIQDEFKHGGVLQTIILITSVLTGAVTGVMTKNWPGAIGSFVATELFLYGGSALVLS